jgi:hypothetical protein
VIPNGAKWAACDGNDCPELRGELPQNTGSCRPKFLEKVIRWGFVRR